MRKINDEVIKASGLREYRFNNYLKHYKQEEFTCAQFLGLEKISFDDKMWVFFSLMDKSSLRFASAEIARLALDSYERIYPNDNRPRKAIEAAEAKVLNKDDLDKALGGVAQATASVDAPSVSCINAAAPALEPGKSLPSSPDLNTPDTAAYAAAVTLYATLACRRDKSQIEQEIIAVVLKYIEQGKE
jgi:hypothetical protein